MWYVFHGPNTLERDEALEQLKAKLGAPEVAAFNITVVERDAPARAVIAACDTLPFLTDYRLVIARNWLTQAEAQRKRAAERERAPEIEAVLAYLPHLPPSTLLVFVEDQTLPDNHPVLALAKQKAGGVHKRFDLPSKPEAWVIERAARKGGAIEPRAAAALCARLPPPSPRDQERYRAEAPLWVHRIDNELEKLIAFANNRPISADDVELLVAEEVNANIFRFTDALAARNAAATWQEANALLTRGEPPLVIMAHIARQVRLLLQAKEHAHLSAAEFAKQIEVHEFVATKALQQARFFGEGELVQMLSLLLEADEAIKTGATDELSALSLLITALCQPNAQR
ncbi:MAG: hypothetical protein RML84_09605 [Anaerolineae bacterium]|nr:hypothetical protein [Anaerolineae bacterium]